VPLRGESVADALDVFTEGERGGFDSLELFAPTEPGVVALGRVVRGCTGIFGEVAVGLQRGVMRGDVFERAGSRGDVRGGSRGDVTVREDSGGEVTVCEESRGEVTVRGEGLGSRGVVLCGV
jgi:hypothetical protein